MLAFEDLDPAHPNLPGPEPEHAARILDIGRAFAGRPLLLHCQAGVGRSPAAALLILADRLGPGREAEALETLLALRPQAVPNLRLVAHGDALLGRAGALLATVVDRDRRDPTMQLRRVRAHAERIGDADLRAACDRGLDAVLVDAEGTVDD